MRHYHGIDVLRFLAAMSVVMFHFGRFRWDAPGDWSGSDRSAFPGLEELTWSGWIGVQVFFVLSGFVIAASAEGATVWTFLLKRAIRVFPALWICGLVALAIRLAWGEPFDARLADFARSAILSPLGPYIDGVVWTLVIEAAFYLFVAGLIAGAARQRQPMRLFDAGAIVLGSISTLFLLANLYAAVVGATDAAELFDRFFFKVLMLRHGVFFALGMLLWSITRNGPSSARVLFAVLFAAMCLVEIFIQTHGSPARALVPIGTWLLAVAGMMASVRWNDRLFAGSGPAWISHIGLMTYPLYLGHFTYGAYLVAFMADDIPDRVVLLCTVLTIILATAWLVMRGPERLLQRWSRRIMLARAPKAPASARWDAVKRPRYLRGPG